MSWFSATSYSEACVSSSFSSSLVFSDRLSSHELVPKTDLKCANHSSEEISLLLPAPLFILLTAFQNDCWSRRFFVKPSHLFSSYSLFFFWSKLWCFVRSVTLVTLSLPPLVLFHRLNNRFTLCLDCLHSLSNHGAPCFFPFRLKNVFFIGSAAFSKRDTNMSSALFGSRAICSVASQ